MRKVNLDSNFIKTEYENGKSTDKIANELGVSRYLITRHIKELGIQLKPRGCYTEPIHVGQRFNKLVVLADIKTKEDKRTKYLVLCDCGKTVKTYGTSLKRGQVACWDCRNLSIHENKWSGYGDISTEHWNSLKWKANKRNIEFLISIEYAWNLFIKQNKKCIFTDIELYFKEYGKSKNTTASLDRIDSSKGYVEGNVQWVHKEINRMKGCLSDIDFINFCKIISKHRNNG